MSFGRLGTKKNFYKMDWNTEEANETNDFVNMLLRDEEYLSIIDEATTLLLNMKDDRTKEVNSKINWNDPNADYLLNVYAKANTDKLFTKYEHKIKNMAVRIYYYTCNKANVTPLAENIISNLNLEMMSNVKEVSTHSDVIYEFYNLLFEISGFIRSKEDMELLQYRIVAVIESLPKLKAVGYSSLSNYSSANHNNSTKGNSSSNGGCYIATMAYGDYEHPQVLELRKFRDNILSKSIFGRGFIKTYYKYSPKLVERLKDKSIINKVIKSMLNIIIRIIK